MVKGKAQTLKTTTKKGRELFRLQRRAEYLKGRLENIGKPGAPATRLAQKAKWRKELGQLNRAIGIRLTNLEKYGTEWEFRDIFKRGEAKITKQIEKERQILEILNQGDPSTVERLYDPIIKQITKNLERRTEAIGILRQMYHKVEWSGSMSYPERGR